MSLALQEAMPSAPRAALRPLCALGFVSLVVASVPVRGQPSCRLEVEVEGVPNASVLREKLLLDAQRSGVCSHAWSLRITRGPDTRFTLLLQKGSSREVRVATSVREIDVVAALLMRAAIDELPLPPLPSGSASAAPAPSTVPSATESAPAPSAPASSPPPAPSAPPSASTPSVEAPPPLPSASPPPPLPPRSAFEAAPTFAVGVSTNTGFALEVGALMTLGRSWRVGLWPALVGSWGHGVVRQDLLLSLVLARSVRVRDDTELGVGVGFGPEGSWVSRRDGSQSGAHGLGVQGAVWPELRVSSAGGWRGWLALPVRYASTSGNTPAGSAAGASLSSTADRLGGWTLMLAVGLAP